MSKLGKKKEKKKITPSKSQYLLIFMYLITLLAFVTIREKTRSDEILIWGYNQYNELL